MMIMVSGVHWDAVVITITPTVQAIIRIATQLILKYDKSGQQFQTEVIRLGNTVDILVRNINLRLWP